MAKTRTPEENEKEKKRKKRIRNFDCDIISSEGRLVHPHLGVSNCALRVLLNRLGRLGC